MYGTIIEWRDVMRKTRNDKKFPVKVWVKEQDKTLFRRHCFEFHLSMMFVGEQYLRTALTEFPDKQIEEIIESRLEKFYKMNSQRDNYEVIGIHLHNNPWQKLAYFAVMYKTSVAKVASCIFDYCLSSYELQIEEEFGLQFNENRKKRMKELGTESRYERTSDY
jgi:hypothetical protein